MKSRIIQIFLVFQVVLLLLFTSTVYAVPSYPASANPADSILQPPDVGAPSAILIESGRGQVLFQKEAKQSLHISAANKIMTALVVIEKEKEKLDSKVTISKESVETEGSALNLEVGEKYTVEDLLCAVMLRSANDAAYALAEYVGGDISRFVTFMNDKAAELNLKDTHFSNPTGLYDETQYTTAYDIAGLIKYAINIPAFDRIFSSKARPWSGGDGITKIITNQNDLFWIYDGVDGGKTGFNNENQHTSITTATKNNHRLICVVLDSPKDSVLSDSTNILDFGFNNFRTGILVKKGEALNNIIVDGKQVNLVSQNDVYYTFPIGENYIKNYEVNITKELVPPIKKSLSAGIARYVLNDNTVIDINLYPDVDIYPPSNFFSSAKSKVAENKNIFILVAFLLLIEIILVINSLIRLVKKKFRKYHNVSKQKR